LTLLHELTTTYSWKDSTWNS